MSDVIKYQLHQADSADSEYPKQTHYLDEEQRLELPEYHKDAPLWNVPENLIETLQSPLCMSLMPVAQRLFLWSFIYGTCPKRYLEIGTAEGGSALIVNSAIKALGFKDFQGVCIDPEFNTTKEVKNILVENFSFFEEFSSLAVMKKAKKKVAGFFDVLLVDGDHTYDYALSDIILAIPFVRPGGYILVDDAGYFQVRDAIQYTVERFNLIDAGFMCRHVMPFEEQHETASEGQWKGEKPFMSGLHILRKPL
ncbi:MAG: class I SAM-dependent methyltransferase [Methylococcales bacterium]|nr:class I SAM-dependent methyltransferase [Methylococcales bacterium]